ncbi:TonB-dependent receptor plug domain-containing protein [Tsuneonella sp. HG222]
MINTKFSMLKAGVAPLAVGFALLSAPAFAQEAVDCETNPNAPSCVSEDDGSANVIIVTGSIVRNPAAASASPITTVSADDLQTRGVSTIAEAVQTLSANNAGTVQPSWSSFGFATGASSPSLRGFNNAYTLTLFNGMRSALYPLGDDGYRNFVDINSIPSSIVDRVDVLLDGASATYGSDAIAGVVNVIVKRQIEGLHLNASFGQTTEYGDATEYKASATYGYGDIDDQGFNVYGNFEYQKNGRLLMRDRPEFNKSYLGDLSGICGTAAQGCLTSNIVNGIQGDNSYLGFGSTYAPAFRPYTGAGTGVQGPYQYGPAGCLDLPSITLTQAQFNSAPAAQQAVIPTNRTLCQQDLSDFTYNSPTQRLGGNLKATFSLGDRAEAFFMVNYMNVQTSGYSTPLNYTGSTAAGGPTVTVSQIYLPAYICPQGVASITGGILSATGCNAQNGTLNPNNPFAAQGLQARLVGRPVSSRGTDTEATTIRYSGGIDGSFGDWNYNVGVAASEVVLERTQFGYIWLPGLFTAVANGGYNFVNPLANTEAQTQLVLPDNFNRSNSKETQVVVSVNRDFFELPGGSLNVAVTGQYRYEAIHNPSANPPNAASPNQRYYSINAVGVDGSREVWSAGYEISAPISDFLRVKAQGSYESYSTGQSKFSPKFEATVQPIEELKFRGTYSRGFRIPSFSESFALPTTGFVSANINCTQATYAAFCAAHASNPSYYSGGYNYGLTSSGNLNLKPETSEAFTIGAVVQPMRNITFTADFWQTEIKDAIVPVTAGLDVFQQYYSNNGVVNIPGITVTPGVADPQNPNALPLIGTVNGSYSNSNTFLGRGMDFTLDASFNISDSLRWRSYVNASYLMRLQSTLANGNVERYDGTLGACHISSCSGAPTWRGVWQNTFTYNDDTRLSLTAYYTDSFSDVATDSAGVYGDCQASADNGQILTWNDGSPVQCSTPSTFYIDGHVEHTFAEKFTLYADVLNILGTKPDFAPNAAYGIYGFAPSWQDRLFVGRFLRVGARVDF